MKKYNIILAVFFLISLFACEDEILKEEPLDFYSTDNSYVTEGDFDIALNELYNNARALYTANAGGGGYRGWTIYWLNADIGFFASRKPEEMYNSLNTSLTPSLDIVQNYWKDLYKMVANANVVYARADAPIVQMKDDAKNRVKAEAAFFRALAYRTLAGLYGGVPLVLEEVKSPRRDFVRASRKEIWEQCATDLKFAVQHLPVVDNVKFPGRLTQGAANHLLSEIYISLEKWQDAVDAASLVIDGGKYSLMKTRFGTRKNEDGDVWWDLFRTGNQHRAEGNTESIWVLNWADEVEGGGDYNLEKRLIPNYRKLKGDDGEAMFIGPTSKNCGRGLGGVRPTRYVWETIWQRSGWDADMRNSKYNVYRDMQIDNPKSAYYGKWIVKDGLVEIEPTGKGQQALWFPMFTKVSTPNNHPEFLLDPNYEGNPEAGLLLKGAGNTYRNVYAMRLAETYLLRAEAYLGLGDKAKAAADINVVRSRATAPAITEAEVDLDYILDERARELFFEELRVVTLSRLGLNYERMKEYDEYRGDEASPRHNLWPIPYSEIERNTDAVLNQNTGYTN